MPKDRGIEHIEKYFGNFTKLVANKIKKQGKVKILDAGCGYGVAMLDIIKKFGDKVEIINVITHINRIQGLLQTVPESQPFDRIEIKFDINTYQNNKTPRFNSGDVGVFLNQAVMISQLLLDEIGELFNV